MEMHKNEIFPLLSELKPWILSNLNDWETRMILKGHRDLVEIVNDSQLAKLKKKKKEYSSHATTMKLIE